MVRVNFEASDAILFGIFLSDVHCGNVRLHDINPQSAYLGIAVFQFDSQRQGLGSKAIRAISEHALSDLRIRNVFAGIHQDNLASIKTFVKAGFIRVDEEDGSENQLWKLSAPAEAYDGVG